MTEEAHDLARAVKLLFMGIATRPNETGAIVADQHALAKALDAAIYPDWEYDQQILPQVDLIRRLNDLGEEGWELVQLGTQADEFVVAIMKRRKFSR